MEKPDRQSAGLTAPAFATIAVVDMVRYSSLARMIEENSGAAAVAELNAQIQRLIRSGLSSVSSADSYCFIANTGDGAILLFEKPGDAHSFAEQLHFKAQEHNRSRTEKTAQRWFRVGIASGEVTQENLSHEKCGYAGIAIANAVRLESAASPGEIVMDRATFDLLPRPIQQHYSSETAVAGKRDEVFRVRRYQVLRKPEKEAQRRFLISRRGMIGLSAGVSGALALGAFVERFELERLYQRWLHPLPDMRHVALKAWPKPADDAAAIVGSIVSSITDRFIRAEPHDRKFVVLVPADLENAGGTLRGDRPADVANDLGANLVLAATSWISSGSLYLTLKVLDGTSEAVMRHSRLSTPLSQISSLNQVATREAAILLDLPAEYALLADAEEQSQMPAEAYQLLARGKDLVSAPNDAKLDDGIEALQSLVNTYPRYALGYAELAQAYLRKYQNFGDAAVLELARQNTDLALKLNPDSLRGLLSRGEINIFTGQTDAAIAVIDKALKLDPMNPDLLVYKAQVYRTLGKLREEEAVYRSVTKNRPNYWLGYNELGVNLQAQAKYPEALDAFMKASNIVPKVSLPVANVGMMYAEAGDKVKAREYLEKSLAIAPDAIAYSGLGDLAFEEQDYTKALAYFEKTRQLKPNSHEALRDVGDCYTMLGQIEMVKDTFARAANLLSNRLKNNPKSINNWMTLAFYHAKIGEFSRAREDISTAEKYGPGDRDSNFMKCQALAVLGEREEAIRALMHCLDLGLEPAEVAIAADLQDIKTDQRYQQRLMSLDR